ncbi:MAG: DUF4214 domain-containing protein [Pseudomonadota bacterium]|nr:DUF4214 domain-containing protein [Pseudomonadota bacterium]
MATQASLDFVQQLYVAYYGRPAESEGLQYWADRADEEGQGAIINAFGESQEFQDSYGDLSNANLVNNLYQQLFGRDADPDGLAYYTGVLNAEEKSLAEIAVTISNAAQGSDKQTFDAKVEAASEYTETSGSADDYNLEVAKQVVEEADGGLYQPDLTEALQNLQEAQDAKEDFLESVADNELVVEELTDADGKADAADADNVTTDEVEAAILQAQTEISKALANARANISDRVLDANLSDSQEAVASYEDEITKVKGLQAAVEAKESAVAEVEAATKAQTSADAGAAGAITTFLQLNNSLTTVSYYKADDTLWDPATDEVSDLAKVVDAGASVAANASTADADTSDNTVLFTVENGQLTAGSSIEEDELEGADSLQTALQAQVDAEADLEDANEADAAADTSLNAITDLSAGDFTNNESDGAGVYAQLSTLEGKVDTNQKAVDDRAELVADAQEINGLDEQLEDAQTSIDDAEDAITDPTEDGGLDVALTDWSSNATASDDLFVFSTEAQGENVASFGVAGEDRIYIGDTFTRVNLDSDASFDDAQGDSSVQEVFFQEINGDTTLSFENAAFAGTATGTGDLTQVTLTGVSVDELQLENGYISIA